MLRCKIILALTAALAGCYAPSPPGGAYRCGPEGDCPSGQHCTCGLCVNQDAQAACGLTIDVSQAPDPVEEHAGFTITLHALGPDKLSPAGAFNGSAELASTWGDVTPSTAQFTAGKATLTVSLNRETIPPQAATLTAAIGAATASSAAINVVTPRFTRDPTPVVPPPPTSGAFGFADVIVAEPNVIKVGNQFRMYFTGVHSGSKGAAIGVATSTDGKTFIPPDAPILQGGENGLSALIASPTVFNGPSGLAMVLLGSGVIFSDAFVLATSSDGNTFAAANGGMPIMSKSDCNTKHPYCQGGLSFPGVNVDPEVGADGVKRWLMYFSAAKGTTLLSGFPDIARASSTDGIHFVPEAAPVLASDFSDEVVLLSPRVMVDGKVLKMFYSTARKGDLGNTGLVGELLFCDPTNKVRVGYATSTDGLFWVRSPSNPVVEVGGAGWDSDAHGLLVGAALPTDGKNAQSGIAVYYSTFRTRMTPSGPACEPDGIGRATRP